MSDSFRSFTTKEVEKKGEDEGQTKGDMEKNGMTWFLDGCSEGNRNNNVPMDLEEYRSFLENKVNLAFAAAAASIARASYSAARADSGSQTTDEDKLLDQDILRLEMKDAELRLKKANYLKRLAEIDLKNYIADIEVRDLKAELETKRARVKVLFERVLGLISDSSQPIRRMSSFDGSVSNTSMDASVSGTNNELSDTSSDDES